MELQRRSWKKQAGIQSKRENGCTPGLTRSRLSARAYGAALSLLTCYVMTLSTFSVSGCLCYRSSVLNFTIYYSSHRPTEGTKSASVQNLGQTRLRRWVLDVGSQGNCDREIWVSVERQQKGGMEYIKRPRYCNNIHNQSSPSLQHPTRLLGKRPRPS